METLPDEIREYIFKFLSSDDLQSMIQVDRYTRCLIENSAALMNNFPIFLTDDDDEFVELCGDERSLTALLASSRKVSRIIVKLKHSKIIRHLEVFKKFNATIRVLDIQNYAFETIDQLRIALRYLQNLRSLSVTCVSVQKPENKILNSIVQIPKLSLKHLRVLNCVNSDPKIFALFTNNCDIQLSEIRLLHCDARTYSYQDFAEMMIHQRRLHSLTVDRATVNNSNIFNYGNFLHCQLSHLEITNCTLTRDQMRRVIDMIKTQRKLNVFKFINTHIPANMDIVYAYKQIFSNRIVNLHVDINQLTFFYSQPFANRSVKNLTLYGNFAFENLPIFINFIKLFPNVVRLKLIGDLPLNDKYLYHILSTYQNLQKLSVPGFTSRTIDSNFSNLASLDIKLKTLILDYIDYDVKFFGWKNIVSNMKSIEKLIIKRDYGKVSNEIVDVILKTLNKLKHLELGIGVVSEEILRNIVYNNCCDELKVLKISRDDFQKIGEKFDFSRIFKRNNLLLHFCDAQYFEQDAIKISLSN